MIKISAFRFSGRLIEWYFSYFSLFSAVYQGLKFDAHKYKERKKLSTVLLCRNVLNVLYIPVLDCEVNYTLHKALPSLVLI